MAATKTRLVFMMLSVLAVGAGTAVLREMQHATVRWFDLTDKPFRDIYSIGQVAPGPNMLMVLLIGHRLAGALGAMVAGVAFFLPDCVLTLAANRLWIHFSRSPWRQSVQQGLAPVAMGLMFLGNLGDREVEPGACDRRSSGFCADRNRHGRHGHPALATIKPGVLVLAGGTTYMLLTH